MSRRYGRNQKRRHRKERADLGRVIVEQGNCIKDFANDLRDAKEKIAEMINAIESICFNSIALPAKKILGSTPMDSLRLTVKEVSDFRAFIGLDPDRVCSATTIIRTIDVYALRTFIKNNYEQFAAAVHLEYSAGRYSAYMISKDALRTMPREKLVRQLVPDVVRLLIEHLREGL